MYLFGIELRSDLGLPGGSAPDVAGTPSVALVPATGLPAPEPDAPGAWIGEIDGRRLVASHVVDALLVEWDGCRFRFDAAALRLEWSGGDPADVGWQRLVLDTIAYLVALELGREALHAGAVVIDGRAVAIAGPTGAGKSTLAHALLELGAGFFSDDIVVLDGVMALPGPGLMTVPAHLRPPGARDIAEVGEERWVEVAAADGPKPLGAVVLLDRRQGAELGVERLSPTPLKLLPYLLSFPRTRDREARRFELAAELVGSTPVHRLVADLTTEPRRLAETTWKLALEGDGDERRDP